MDVLTGIGAFWLSTWVMILFRTVSIVDKLVDTYEITLIQKYRAFHYIIYAFSTLLIAPLLWQIVVSDYSRKKFIISYVDALRKRK
tara:strand:+ start:50 stop:307 length:258 start_codon:yes stop_codon:yes gene_type:complete